MQKLSLAAITLTMGTAVALVPAATHAAAPATYSWTGCHAGLNGGLIHDGSTLSLNPSGAYLTPAGVLAPPNAAGTGALAGDLAVVTTSYNRDDVGVVGGLQIGCDLALADAGALGLDPMVALGAPLVFGFEADFSGSTLGQSVNAAYAPVTSANPLFTVSERTENTASKLSWISTVRGRAGITPFPELLIYATGGLAIANFNSHTTVTFGSTGSSPVYALARHTSSNTDTPLGSVFGAGAEYAMTDQMSIKAEYLFFNFPSQTFTSPLNPAGTNAPGYSWTTRVAGRSPQIFRVGVNVKLY